MSDLKLYEVETLEIGDKVYNLDGDILLILGRRKDNCWLVERIRDSRIMHMTDDLMMVDVIGQEVDNDDAYKNNDAEIERWLGTSDPVRPDGLPPSGRGNDLGEVPSTGVIYLPYRS